MSWEQDSDFVEALSDFARILGVLDPYRNEIIVAGGFAAFLYRYVGPGPAKPEDAILTYDLDLVVPRKFKSKHRPKIGELIDDSDLVLVHVSNGNPAKTVIACRDRVRDRQLYPTVYTEFLTDALGAELRTIDYGGGIGVSELRYLRFLSLAPTIDLDLGVCEVVSLRPLGKLRLFHPLNFIIQKILMTRAAGPDQFDRRRKDSTYIVDVVRLFFHELADWRPVWQSIAANKSISERWINRFGNRFDERFGNAGAFGVQEVSNELSASPMEAESEPEAIALLMSRFRERVTGI